MSRLKSLLQREPVRVYLYGVAGTVIGGLAAHGLLTGDDAELARTLAGALLAIPTIEGARSMVSPVAAP